jgi:hypothetical protein
MEEITWQTPEPWASEVQPGKSLPSDVSDELRKLSVCNKENSRRGSKKDPELRRPEFQ